MKKFLLPVFLLSIMAAVFVLAMAPNPALHYDPVRKDPVDLNKASKMELESLLGIGPATAKKIIENRPYKSVYELSKAGVSDVIIHKYLELHVIVGPAASPAEPVETVMVAEASGKAQPAKEKAKVEAAGQ